MFICRFLAAVWFVLFATGTAVSLTSNGVLPWWTGLAVATFTSFVTGIAVWIIDPSGFED